HVTDGARATVTSQRTDSYSPTWSPDGKWLAFLSDRELRSLTSSPWGPLQPEPFFTDATRIYLLALTAGLRSPFEAPDELHQETGKAGKEEKKTEEEKEKGKEKEEQEPEGEKGKGGPEEKKDEPGDEPDAKDEGRKKKGDAAASTNGVPKVKVTV